MIIAAIATLLWYCVDDHLAMIFGNEAVGLIPWWIVFILFWIVKILFIRSDDD